MLKGKFIKTTKIKDYKSGGADVEFSIYGVFNTEKVHWDYYVVSHITGSNSKYVMTSDLHKYEMAMTIDNIRAYGKKYDTKEECDKFITEYKDKWELMTNDTKSESRDKKITDVLGGDSCGA